MLQPSPRLAEVTLVSSDLDGTILENRPSFTGELISRLTEWKAADGRFAIVTGRPPWDLFRIIGQTDIEPLLDAVICEERDIYIRRGPEWVQLGDHCQQLALELGGLPDAEIVAATLAEASDSRMWGMKRSEVEMELRRGYIEVYFSEPELAEAARGLAADCIRSNGFFLSAMRNVRHLSLRHPFSKKGFALRALAAFWGIQPSGVAAVGDSLNDMSMLDGTMGFIGAAVANSDPAILDAVGATGLALPEARSAGVACLLGLLLESKRRYPSEEAI